MKKKQVYILTLLACCSLAAYVFLFQAQMLSLGDAATQDIPQQLMSAVEPAATPELTFLKRVMNALMNLLPAS